MNPGADKNNRVKHLSNIFSCCICLSHNDLLTEYLLNKYNENCEKNKKSTISYFLAQFFLQSKKEEKGNIGPLFAKIVEENKILNENSFFEFLILLLNELHNEDKSIIKNIKEKVIIDDFYTNWINYNYILQENEAKSFIFSNYSWINKKEIKCLGCNTTSESYSYYFTYDLNLSSALNKIIILKEENKDKQNNIINPNEPLTIKQLIKFNSDSEKLYNVYCPKCEQKTIKERKSNIYQSSPYFIVLFSDIQNPNTINLLKDNEIYIQIEKKLDIADIKEFEKNKNTSYEINSIILYEPNYKKYIAYLYRSHFNDWLRLTGLEKKVLNNEDFLNFNDSKFIPVIAFYNHLKIEEQHK